ncbi:hypothetical protein HDU67_003213 [Dinochytrium kinnereticum]|nr:hypothetical protein HDU67_003213 [Dinochytrium kinnereticum]
MSENKETTNEQHQEETVQFNGRTFRRVKCEESLLAYAKMVAVCYPVAKLYATEENHREMLKSIKKRRDTDSRLSYWGIFDKDASPVTSATVTERSDTHLVATPGLLAGSLHIDFEMNLFGLKKYIGGLAGVGTDILQKKKGLAKDLVLHFLSECDRKSQALAALHPFRPDFYYQMGFGFSSPNYEYSILPSSFPKNLPVITSKSEPQGSVVQLLHTDTAEMVEFCTRYVSKHHGAFYMETADINKFIWDTKFLSFGYRDANGVLQGFIAFDFHGVNGGFMPNDMVVSQFLWLGHEALSHLLNFFRTQEDQVRFVVLRTQDPDIHFLLKDVRNAEDPFRYTSRCGIKTSNRGSAMMFRIVNLRMLFTSYLSDHDFNCVDNLRIIIEAEDTFLPNNSKPILLSFTNGKVKVVNEEDQDPYSLTFDAVLKLSINNLASLIVGSVTLKSLIFHGTAIVAPESLATRCGRVFHVDETPINFIEF